MAVQTKISRIDIRINPEDKEMLEMAAALKRVSLSSFILSAAIEIAKMDIEREETIVLSNKQRDEIMALLDNPPEPNEALKNLFKKW